VRLSRYSTGMWTGARRRGGQAGCGGGGLRGDVDLDAGAPRAKEERPVRQRGALESAEGAGEVRVHVMKKNRDRSMP
jgi:hypothetical protein